MEDAKIPNKPGALSLDPKVHARELGNLKDVIDSITEERLTSWIRENTEDRSKLLADTVWGHIRWPKSLGRPSDPLMGNGFVIEHSFYFVTHAVIQGGDIIEKGKWLPLPEPSKWNAQDDDDHYRVNFVTSAPRVFQNRLEVRFNDDVIWRNPNEFIAAGYRRIDPQAWWFSQIGDVTVLPFDIVQVPYGITKAKF